MYQQFYSDGLYLNFPILALFVFLSVFLGVVSWALFLAPKDATAHRLDRLAQLPLSDGEARHEQG